MVLSLDSNGEREVRVHEVDSLPVEEVLLLQGEVLLGPLSRGAAPLSLPMHGVQSRHKSIMQSLVRVNVLVFGTRS